jgi:hypothetical protein
MVHSRTLHIVSVVSYLSSDAVRVHTAWWIVIGNKWEELETDWCDERRWLFSNFVCVFAAFTGTLARWLLDIVKFYCAPELIAARQLFARISLCRCFLNGDFYCPRGKVSVLFSKQRTLKKEMLKKQIIFLIEQTSFSWKRHLPKSSLAALSWLLMQMRCN